ncbi:MAG TPA: AI-2E family transporter [Deltaproteobacteria bacterium]|nr:AI-2E family transporter [Deltaproteobacteria bacterium]
MDSSYYTSDNKFFVARALEVTIRVGIVILLFFWCFRIAQPFIEIVLWGVIIAVAISPAHQWVSSSLGGRNKLSAILITLLLLIILIIPSLMFAASLVETAEKLSSGISRGTIRIPDVPEHIKSWPAVGQYLYDFWKLSSENIMGALGKIAPQIKAVGLWLLNSVAGAGFGILSFIVAIIIAGVLLSNSERGVQVARGIAVRLAGERGEEFVRLSGATMRSVARGILGVAVIQAILSGIGCLVVGVPAAGLWALFVLILAVIQLPTILILGPIIVYVFYTANTLPAVLFAIWGILVGGCDSFLKPLLMGRGVDVPMLVVFIGAIGGFIYSGIIGLFIGAVILSLGFKLFQAWLETDANLEAALEESPLP